MPLNNNAAPAQMVQQFNTLLASYNSDLQSAASTWVQLQGIHKALRELAGMGIPFTGPASVETIVPPCVGISLPLPADAQASGLAYGMGLFDTYNA